MAKPYKRKRITSLDALDREEAKLRKKSKQIEQEWEEILDPQQLAINFLTSFIGRKLANRKSTKKEPVVVQKTKQVANNLASIPQNKTKQKKSGFKKAAKTIGIAVAVFFVVKKIMQMRSQNKNAANATGY